MPLFEKSLDIKIVCLIIIMSFHGNQNIAVCFVSCGQLQNILRDCVHNTHGDIFDWTCNLSSFVFLRPLLY